jgi:uncharacterized Tic20 family protein
MDQPPPLSPPATNEGEKLWIILSHLSLLLGVGFLLPLIVYLVKKDSNPVTAAHAKEALLFHISVILYVIISIVLMFVFIGVLTLFAVLVMAVVCSIIACVKAADGQFYRYPLTLRFF